MNEGINNWEKELADQMGANADFSIANVSYRGQPTTLYYLKSLVDLTETLAIMEPLMEKSTNVEASLTELGFTLLSGQILVSQANSDIPSVITPKELQLHRQVTSAQNEHPLQTAFDSFTEDLNINIGLLRRKIKKINLSVESYTSGSSFRRDLSFIYLNGEGNPNVITYIKEKLRKNGSNDIHNVEDLLKMLEQPKYSLVPMHLSTELPEEAAKNLLEGKVIIFLDEFPFALVFPAIIKDLWSIRSDLNYPPLFRGFYHFIRIAGILFAVVTPSLYIIMSTVNPELLRIQLALSVAKSREGIPYPSIVEVCLMLLLMEMVIEATIRLPKGIGPTITMVGGIILGQAIVEAHLVSNLLIIVLAASTIANFTITGYLNTIGIRMFKYISLFLSTAFGIYGLEAAIIWICIYFAGLQSSSIPYMSLSLKGKGINE